MKSSYPLKHQKPIKYKQFIQQLHNSSHSSLQDVSILSQRSFRDNSIKGNKNDDRTSSNKNSCEEDKQLSSQVDTFRRSCNNVKRVKQNGGRNSVQQQVDKLFTFCDAKLTQRSIQFIENNKNLPIHQNNNKDKVSHLLRQQKYFRTQNKQNKKNQQKQNINFVNKILEKVQMIQGKLTKKQQFNDKEDIIQALTRRDNSQQELITSNHQVVAKQGNNSQRKIQSIKKVCLGSSSLSMKQSITRGNSNKMNASVSASLSAIDVQTKSRQVSLGKKCGQRQRQKQIEDQQKLKESSQPQSKQGSSKKKVVSLNINHLKTSNQNYNKIKLKLSMDRSSEKEKFFQQTTSQIQTKKKQSQGNLLIVEPHSQRLQSSIVQSFSMKRMPSLQQSKIEGLNSEGSRSNLLLMSGISVLELGDVFMRKSSQVNNMQYGLQDVNNLQRIISDYKQRQNSLTKQLFQLNQRLKHPNNQPQPKHQLQILQKDCHRLTSSYKEIKRLYQLMMQQKQQLTQQLCQVKSQNDDLKQCLTHKSRIVEQLESRINQLQTKVLDLQHQVQQKSTYPQQLHGLSTAITQKLHQYQTTISSLLQQNQNLQQIKQKLQNYNLTLQQQLEEKDQLLHQYQTQLKANQTQLRMSLRQDNEDRRVQDVYYGRVKDLESKLNLANVHIQYLTKQLVEIKHTGKMQVVRRYGDDGDSEGDDVDAHGRNANNIMGKPMLTTIANTITTRNSSICYNNGHQDPLYTRKANSSTE